MPTKKLTISMKELEELNNPPKRKLTVRWDPNLQQDMSALKELNNTSSKPKESKQRIEGYWYSKYEPFYPMPIPDILSEKQALEIFKLIRDKEAKCISYEKYMSTTEIRPWKEIYPKVESFMGCSESRLSGTMLGNLEYEYEEWKWPGDFADHYVLINKVKPSSEFLKWIGYEYNSLSI